MISCGEASGDMYAGALAAELRRRAPDAEIFGFGGPRLQDAGGRLIGDYGPLSVTGLTEAVKVVPRSFAMLRKLVDAARDLRPHVFVAIDFPDFNFRSWRRSAVSESRSSTTSVRSSGRGAPGRMETMKEMRRSGARDFPFEEALYRRAGVSVQFVGHPLVDLIRPGQRSHGLSARPRSQTRRADRGAAARQPAQRTGSHRPGGDAALSRFVRGFQTCSSSWRVRPACPTTCLPRCS